MSEVTANNKNARNDEIDLPDLFRRMGKKLNTWGLALGRALLISIVFLLKKWLPLTLSVVGGIALSYLFKSTSPSSYTSDLVFRNNLALMDGPTRRDNSGTTAEMIAKYNKLHILCAENNSASLAYALLMNSESVKNISDISAFWIIDKSKDGIPDYVDYKDNYNASDTTNIRMQDRLDIRVKIKSPQDLLFVRNGIIKYIQNDSLYQQRNRLRLKQNQEMLTRLDYDIIQLDSLQKVKYFEEARNMQPKNGGQMIFLQEQKTQLIYTDIYSLYAQKHSLESERDLYKDIVTVLSEFSILTRRDNGTVFYAKIIVPITFCLTLIVLLMVANRKKIKEIYKTY